MIGDAFHCFPPTDHWQYTLAMLPKPTTEQTWFSGNFIFVEMRKYLHFMSLSSGDELRAARFFAKMSNSATRIFQSIRPNNTALLTVYFTLTFK